MWAASARSNTSTHCAQLRPVLAATAASLMPPSFAKSDLGTGDALAADAGALFAAGVGFVFFRVTWARAAVYDSPVFCMRERTTRLRSFFGVMAVSFGIADARTLRRRNT